MNFFGNAARKELQTEVQAGFQAMAQLGDDRNKHTPDWSTLSRRQFQRVFIYDTQMKQHHQHRELPDFGQFKAVGFTLDPFELWKKKLGKFTFPIALPSRHKTVKLLPVKGELWQVYSERLLDLDNAHENGVQFHRVRATINIPYRKVLFLKERATTYYRDPMKEPTSQSVITNNHENLMQVTAWVYLGVPEYWEPLLDGGYTTGNCQVFNSEKENRKQYYYFSPMELNE